MDKKETLFSFPVNRFLGLNTQSGSASLETGQSPYMKNFRIGDGYSLIKRDGYISLHDFGEKIRAVLTVHRDTDILFIAAGQKIYTVPLPFDGERLREAGSIGQSDNCFFMEYFGNVYLWGGGKVQKYDSETMTFSDAEPYRPLIAVSCGVHDYSGTPFEEVNMLGGAVKKQFSTPSDGYRTFNLHRLPCKSVDYVKIGTRTLESSLYSATPDNNSILISSEVDVPAGTNIVEIGYTLDNVSENYEKIVNCTHFMFYGGENDTKVFLWGNPEFPDGRFHSAIVDGEPSAVYFPESSFTRIGDGRRINDIIRQYDRQIIFCDGSAYVSYIEEKVDALGRKGFSFPVRTLSDTKGSVPIGQAKLIDNVPVTLAYDGLYKWPSTSQRDERNTLNISERINNELAKEDIKSAKIFDCEREGELYIYFPNGRVYVYAYRKDVFFMYEGIFAHTFFCGSDGTLYFAGNDGRIYMFGGFTSDDGQPIECVWHSNYMDMGYFGKKNLYSIAVMYRQHNNTAFDINWVSDNDTDTCYTSPCVIKSRVLDFTAPSFNFFSFRTAHAVKNIKHRMRTKRFRYLKIIFKNNSRNNRIHIHRFCLSGKNTEC